MLLDSFCVASVVSFPPLLGTAKPLSDGICHDSNNTGSLLGFLWAASLHPPVLSGEDLPRQLVWKGKKNHSLTITLLANGRGRERGVCGFLFQSYKCQHFTAGVGGSWAAPPASVQPVCTMKEVLTTALLCERTGSVQWQVYLRCGPVNRGVHPWCLCSDKQDQSSAGCLFIYQIHQNENINRVSNIWQSPLFPPFFLLFI